jgi:hypothetical protein
LNSFNPARTATLRIAAFAIDSRWRNPTATKVRNSRIAASRSISCHFSSVNLSAIPAAGQYEFEPQSHLPIFYKGPSAQARQANESMTITKRRGTNPRQVEG